jgi:RNA polymerase sigma-70 factor (ECF subfamily)
MTPLLAEQLRADRSFERIYRKHVGDVYRYALAVLRQPSDAEDVAQTTFLNAYRAYQQGERPRNAQNWLIAIAHNVCRQRFRQAQRRPDEVEFDDRVGEIVPEDDRGPKAEDIQRALGHLAFNQRAALVMRELEGRSYAEIAEILETSVSAVETLLFRARRALREQLEGTLTCAEAELAISRQTDGRLARPERSALRAHLRQCKECERLARSQRAHKKAFKALALVPIPTSLTSLFGGGGAVVGGGVALKAAAFVAAGVVATGVGYEGARELSPPSRQPEAVVPATTAAVQPGAPIVAPVLRAPGTKPLPGAAQEKVKARGPRGRAVAPGQAKKQAAPAASVKATPPGQVQKAAHRPVRPKPASPGQAKKAAPKPKRAAAGRKLAQVSAGVGIFPGGRALVPTRSHGRPLGSGYLPQ